MRTHLSEIRSFEKLSTEGTTFAAANLLVILEERLPARFGGTALDYQMVEEETDGGGRMLVLLVHPSVGPLDEGAVRVALLEEMGRGGMADAYQAGLIERANALIVRRRAPIVTAAGKVLPLQVSTGPGASGGDRHDGAAGRPVDAGGPAAVSSA